MVRKGPITMEDELSQGKFSTWWGRRELRRWCKFLKIRDMSSTFLAYWEGLSTRTSASSKICSCNSLFSDLSSFLKSGIDKNLLETTEYNLDLVHWRWWWSTSPSNIFFKLNKRNGDGKIKSTQHQLYAQRLKMTKFNYCEGSKHMEHIFVCSLFLNMVKY